MTDISAIKASDGSGNASVATVQSSRSPGATTLSVDTTTGIPATFFGTMGTPHTFTDPVTSETITVISEATAVDFYGHVDAGNLEIDTIAPGYTDAGSEVGDIIVIRPTTQYADNLAAVAQDLQDASTQAADVFADFVEAGGGVWSQTSGLTGAMTSGNIWYQGKEYAISAIASKAFTASKDTYVDIDSADTVTYVEVANGAAEPAVTASSVRVAKVVTDGSGITSIDQAPYNAPVGNSQVRDNSLEASKLVTLSEKFYVLPSDLPKATRAWAQISSLSVTPTISGDMSISTGHLFGFDTAAQKEQVRIKVDGTVVMTGAANVQAGAALFAYYGLHAEKTGVVAGTTYVISVEANHTTCNVASQFLEAVISK